MELNSGLCDICYSGNEVISHKDSDSFWETVCELFKDEFDNLKILQPHLKICSTCIFHANLIDKKKNILTKEISDIDITGRNKCRFCKDSINLLKVENSAILKTFESHRTSRGKGWSVVCAWCYYVIKANYNLKTNLSNKLSECNTSPSAMKYGLHCIKTEKDVSDDEGSTISRSKNNLVDARNECTEIMCRSDISDDKVDGEDAHSPADRLSQKGKKKIYTRSEDTRSEETIENVKKLSITYGVRNTRKRKSTSPREEIVPKLKKVLVQSNKVNNLDMSKVLCLMPLSKTNVIVNEAIRRDAKFYYSIPYVQVPIFNESKKNTSDVPEQILKIRQLASPTGIIKRTPPIKIKLKKITKLKKGSMEKKQTRKILTKDELSENTMFDEFKRKEVVVKVERLIIPTNEKKVQSDLENAEEKVQSNLENAESEHSVVAYESVLKNTSTIEVTPKKKKKVHFNDTPTIIITSDDLPDDPTNEEDISKRKNTKNGKVLKYEKESLEEQYSIEINSEESEDEAEVKIQEDNVGQNVTKLIKEDTSKSQNTGADNVELMEIDVTEDESEQLASSPDELNDQGDDINSCKEPAQKTVELKNVEEQDTEEHVTVENVIVGDIEGEEKNLVQENKSIEESMEIDKVGSVKEKNEVEEKKEAEKTHLEQTETMDIIDSDVEEPSSEEMTSLQLIDECCDEEQEEILKDGSEKRAQSETENTGEFPENGNVEEVEKKQEEEELDTDKIVVNDIVLSEATPASEAFDTLIDVKQCLPSKDLSSENVLEINDSSDESEPLLCLSDIDKEIDDNTFAENLIDDDDTNNVESDTSSVDKENKEKLIIEDDTPEESITSTKLSDSLK